MLLLLLLFIVVGSGCVVSWVDWIWKDELWRGEEMVNCLDIRTLIIQGAICCLRTFLCCCIALDKDHCSKLFGWLIRLWYVLQC